MTLVMPTFCIVGTMRSGSNFLQAMIHSSFEMDCFGEILNKNSLSKNTPYNSGNVPAAANANVLEAVQPLFTKYELLANGRPWGFRVFDNHDNRVLARLIGSSSVKVIVLRRKLLASYCSLHNAVRTGQWRLAHEKNRKPTLNSLEIDIDDFVAYFESNLGFYSFVENCVGSSEKSVLKLDYEGLVEAKLYANAISDFLELNYPISHANVDTIKQISQPLEKFVLNYEEITNDLSHRGYDSEFIKNLGFNV